MHQAVFADIQVARTRAAAPIAWLAFGEYYFNNSKGLRPELVKALAAYKKASSYPENKVYLYSLYKQGWCYFNLADFPQSLDMFKTVIQFADLQSSLNSGNKLKLAKDARRDYVLAYSRYGSALAAKDDFQKVGGPDNWWAMLKGLAGLYYDDGKDKESILVYRQLIRERPLSPEAPFFQAPIVDAAMRCLQATGTMHNRLRMVVASFLTKDLGLDWRWGEAYFAQALLDFDLAANNGGWQWAASTGCDAQPYFRIFNPVTQSQKFDPQGQFIRRYLPALGALAAPWIHAPWSAPPEVLAAAGVVLGRDYPSPIVDHDAARALTLKRFAVVRGGAAAPDQAATAGLRV